MTRISREWPDLGTAQGETRRRQVIAVAVALIAAWALLAACGGGGGPRDPASPGPYGVGMTTITFTRPSTTTGAPRPLETVIWFPTDASGGGEPKIDASPATHGGPFPVVTFSHGDAGTPGEASYFTEHLASWGFVVVAPAHFGNRKQDCPCSVEAENDSFANRVPDIIFVLDSVLAMKDDPSQPIGKIIDPERIVDTGYSFGGWTAVAAAPSGRFDAVIAMAPGAPTLLVEPARNIRVPVLLFGAVKDDRVDDAGVRDLYKTLPTDIARDYVDFPQAGHHAFRNVCERLCEFPQERAHELVMRYATAFLEVHVVGDERYRAALERSDPPDALVEHSGG